MKNLKIKIQKMLTESVLVSAKQKQKISRDLENYSKDQLIILHSFLSEAKTNQKTLLWQAVKKNPNFIKSIKRAFVHGSGVVRKSKETAIGKIEEQDLLNLEQELQNI
jgi:hypothetical protein